MKVFISADIEGITGLVSWSQCGAPDGKSYDFGYARRMMAHDVNAAIRGARKAGAKEIVVKDSHGNSKNLLIEDLEPGVRLVSGHGSGFTDGMMQGIDDTFDAALLVGYHAMAGTARGVMEHTISGGIHRLKINGEDMGEIGLSAAVAGRFRVPLVAISSDAAGCLEAESLVPGLRPAVTKQGLGRYSAEMLHPDDTGPLIEKATEEGVRARARVKPFVPKLPVKLSIEFNRSEEADMCERHAAMSRVDAYTVAGSFDNFVDAHAAVWALVSLSFQGIASQQ